MMCTLCYALTCQITYFFNSLQNITLHVGDFVIVPLGNFAQFNYKRLGFGPIVMYDVIKLM